MMRKRNKQDKSEKGTLEFALGNLFECVCCIHSGITYEEKRLNEINESLQQINKRLNLLDRFDGLIIYSHYEIKFQLLISFSFSYLLFISLLSRKIQVIYIIIYFSHF